MKRRSTVAWIWITWRGKWNRISLISSSWWSRPTAWTLSQHADARERWTQTTVSRKGIHASFSWSLRNLFLVLSSFNGTFMCRSLNIWYNNEILREPKCSTENISWDWLCFCSSSSSQKHGGELLCSPAAHWFPPWFGLEVDPWAQWLRCQLLLWAMPLPEELRHNAQLGKWDFAEGVLHSRIYSSRNKISTS